MGLRHIGRETAPVVRCPGQEVVRAANVAVRRTFCLIRQYKRVFLRMKNGPEAWLLWKSVGVGTMVETVDLIPCHVGMAISVTRVLIN
jgi:hypothetical protein